MTTDIAKLQYDFDPTHAVQVVKHDYKTRHPIKYKGTDMMCPNVDYPRKNWASVMLINCEHELWRAVKPAFVRDMPDKWLLQFGFLPDEAIGDLPDEWNRLVDEGQDPEGGAILHWTAGIPGFPEYRNAPGAGLWHLEKRLMEFV